MSGTGWDVVEIEEVADHAPLLRRVYDEVLRPSFGRSELPDEASLLASLRADQYATVAIADGDPIAVAVSSRPTAGPVGILSYLAARPGTRSRGSGGRLLEHCIGRWRERGPALVLGEVHDPRAHATTDDERPLDRLRFYERRGSELVWSPWLQPALSPSTPRVGGMLLLAIARAAPFDGPTLPPGALLAWAEDYYRSSEGAVPDDPAYRELVARLDPPGGLEVRPVAAYPELEPLREP